VSDSEATVVTARGERERRGPPWRPTEHSLASDFEKGLRRPRLRFYRSLVADCVTRAEPGRFSSRRRARAFSWRPAAVRSSLHWPRGSEHAVRLAGAATRSTSANTISATLAILGRDLQRGRCNQTIEHLTPPIAETAARELSRLATARLARDLLALPARPVQAAEPTHINLYTPARLRAGVSAAGFGDYCAYDSPRLLLGGSRPLEIC